MRSYRHQTRKSRGQALVEFALVGTIFLILALGLIQYGIILQASTAMSQISRDTARVLALAPNANLALGTYATRSTANPPTNIWGYVIDYATNTGVSPSDLTVAVSDYNRNTGDQFTVTISYPMNKKIFVPFLPGVSQFNGTRSVSTTMIQQAN